MGRFLTLMSTTIFFSCGNKCENWRISVETPEPPPADTGAQYLLILPRRAPPSLQYERDSLIEDLRLLGLVRLQQGVGVPLVAGAP